MNLAHQPFETDDPLRDHTMSLVSDLYIDTEFHKDDHIRTLRRPQSSYGRVMCKSARVLDFSP